MFSVWVLLGLGILCIASVASQVQLRHDIPHVQLRNGVLVGRNLKSRDGNNYFSFEGIRFAAVRRRFEPPESLSDETWTGIKYATKPGPKCAQLSSFIDLISGEEDCLYLNVHVPTIVDKDPLPVMVFFHGGAYREGEGDSYGPQYFMDVNVILVTLNYRLGPLGFLSTGDGVVPGNMGLKDQVYAMKWVKKNIGSFGGDTNRITLVGHSAGSSSVHLHMLSPMSKGLFHRAILQSGTGTSFWSYKRKEIAVSLAKKLGEIFKCPTLESLELVECLRNINVEDLLRAQKQFIRWYRDPLAVFVPTIEDVNYQTGNSFLIDNPESLIERHEYHKVPMILGMTKDEGLLLHAVEVLLDEKLTSDLNTNWNKLAPITFYLEDVILKSDQETVAEKFRKFYFGEKLIGPNTFENLTNIYSDAIFTYSFINNVILHAKGGDVYLYLLMYQGEFSLTTYYGQGDIYGVSHCDELQYFFNSSAGYSPKVVPSPDSPSGIFSRNLLKLWASFARTGNPSDTWSSFKIWQPISPEEKAGKTPLKFLKLDTNPELVENPFQERYETWKAIFEEHGVWQAEQRSRLRLEL